MSQTLFYGVPMGCSFGSIVALEWLGEPYRLVRVEMPEVASSEAYRAVNPLGETPMFQTESGELLSQSMAILNHIAERGIDKGLGFKQGTAAFDRLNQMLAFLNTSFFNAFSPLWYALENGSDETEKRGLTAYGQEEVRKAHDQLSKLVGDAPWLLGEQRTLADAYFAGIARWNDYHQVLDRSQYPNLQRLYEKLEDDPAVVFAHAIEDARSARSTGQFLGEEPFNEWKARSQRAA